MVAIIKKIIFLAPNEFSKKINEDLCVTNLIANGFKVEYWNVGNLTFYKDIKSDIKYHYKSLVDIETSILKGNNKKALYVMLHTFNFRSLALYRLVSKMNLKLIYLNWGLQANLFPISNLIGKRFIERPLSTIYKMLQKMIAVFFLEARLIKPFDVCLTSEKITSPHLLRSKIIKKINYADYDKYLLSKNKKIITGNYAVFLDINLTQHKDRKIFNFKEMNSKRYYDLLNNFFSLVEKKFNIKVVISAHPTRNKKVNYFNKRKLYYGKTANLVRGAKFVISHHSLSTSFAVLNNKPIIFLFSEEMDEYIIFFIKGLSSLFKMTLFNLDAITFDDIKYNKISEESYLKYKYNYLTSHETEFFLNKNLFVDSFVGLTEN